MIEWMTTTDHKKIGIMYIVATMTFFVIAGILAMLIRAQLARPENDFLTRMPTIRYSHCTERR